MNNERTLVIVNELVDMKGKSTYECEMLWCELYEECIKELRKMVYKKHYTFASDYAQEDFEQDVMITIYKKLHEYDAMRAKVSTWIHMISANIYIKFYNERKRLKEKGFETISMYKENDDNEVINMIDLNKGSKSVEKEYFYKLSCERLYNAIYNLKDNYRDSVILCDMEGLKPREASKVLGCKNEDVYRHLNRAHNKLKRTILNEELDEEFFDEYEL